MQKNLTVLLSTLFFSAVIHAQEMTICPDSITCRGNICTRPDTLSGSWKCAYRPTPRYPGMITLPWVRAHIRTLSYTTCDYSDGNFVVQCVARVHHSAIHLEHWRGTPDSKICTTNPSACAIEMNNNVIGKHLDRNAPHCQSCIEN
jgi:hypothetical protein